MRFVDPILRRLASQRDRKLLDEDNRRVTRLRVLARVGLRHFWIYIGLLLIGTVVTFASGMDIYHRTESIKFCGTCHEMRKQEARWKAPLHKSLACADCHTRPGLGGWVSAKMGGMRQAYHHFTADSEDDLWQKLDMTKQYQITSENCRRCHLGATRLRERDGIVIAHNRHLEIGLQCVDCHSRKFAHPSADEPEDGDEEAGSTDEGVETAAVAGVAEPLLADRQDCIDCHQARTRKGDATAFPVDDDSNCARCHVDSAIANRHGGARVSCTDCHETGDEGTHYPIPRGDVSEAICENCHDIERGYTSTHGAFEKGLCLECHHVMSPSHHYVTGSKPTADTCLVCHDRIASVLADMHGPDRTRFATDERDLHRHHAALLSSDSVWCLYCHSPHGSDAPVAQIELRDAEDDREDDPTGVFETRDGKGICTGACHDGETVEYPRQEGKAR